MKTNLSTLITLITLLAILLVGCSSASTTTVSASSSLSSATILATATLKLEDTSQAVSSSQAAELLTLWEGYQSLSNSDTTSQVELEALVKQIQAAMTSEQIKAIDAMDLTDQSVSEVMSTLGGSDTITAPANTPSTSGLSRARPGSGPVGMPGGGDSVMSAINLGMGAQGTPAVTITATSTDKMLVNPVLIQGLIRLLEMRSQSAG